MTRFAESSWNPRVGDIATGEALEFRSQGLIQRRRDQTCSSLVGVKVVEPHRLGGVVERCAEVDDVFGQPACGGGVGGLRVGGRLGRQPGVVNRDGVFNRDLLSQRDSSRVDERDEGGYLRR